MRRRYFATILVICFLSGCGMRATSPFPALPQTPMLRQAKPDNAILLPIAQAESWPQVERSILPEAAAWCAVYDSHYGSETSKALLLTAEEIDALNRDIIAHCPSVRDMATEPTERSGKEIRELMESYHVPQFRYHNGETYISDSEIAAMLDNRGIEQLPKTVELQRALVTARCNLRSFPTEYTFHQKSDRYYDNLQQTELITGWPVLVAGESKDGNYVFLLSYYYAGWVEKCYIAYCTDEDYEAACAPQQFVTVVAKKAACGEAQLDMGVRLQLLWEEQDGYCVQLPVRTEEGLLSYEQQLIAKEDAVRGYLPYTAEHYYNQAFAFLGDDYDWGGGKGGVDCSGLICTVMRSFGIYLPRNAGEQGMYAAYAMAHAGAKRNIMKPPAGLYAQGHAMLYLGKKDGKHYAIHAPEGGVPVCVKEIGTTGRQLWTVWK